MLQLSKKLILGSNSPRRKEILHAMGFDFECKAFPTEEDFSDEMPLEEVPVYLAIKKAIVFEDTLKNDTIVLTADTVVILGDEILNKPNSPQEAKEMLALLSGKKHRVITGVCILTSDELIQFSDETHVFLKELSDVEIDYYVDNFKPLDKAGAYGIQDFIGLIGIERLEGSFYTVMGLPAHKVYEKLKNFST